MDKQAIIAKLDAEGIALETEREIDHAVQLQFAGGVIVNCFHNGRIQFQGKRAKEIKNLLGVDQEEGKAMATAAKAVRNNKVFVVYGHDQGARDSLEAMLRRWNLEPLILDQLPSEGQTIIEKLESYTSQVNFAVVLATPDDVGHRKGHPDELSFRARQNVVMELGKLLAILDRKRVAILLNQQENMERPSDIQGLIYIPYKDDMAKEAGLTLAKEMGAQGYHIDLKNI